MWHPPVRRAHCVPHVSIAVAFTDFLTCQAPIRQQPALGALCCFEVFSVTIRFFQLKMIICTRRQPTVATHKWFPDQVSFTSGKSSINPFLRKSECFQSWRYTGQGSVRQPRKLRGGGATRSPRPEHRGHPTGSALSPQLLGKPDSRDFT